MTTTRTDTQQGDFWRSTTNWGSRPQDGWNPYFDSLLWDTWELGVGLQLRSCSRADDTCDGMPAACGSGGGDCTGQGGLSSPKRCASNTDSCVKAVATGALAVNGVATNRTRFERLPLSGCFAGTCDELRAAWIAATNDTVNATLDGWECESHQITDPPPLGEVACGVYETSCEAYLVHAHVFTQLDGGANSVPGSEYDKPHFIKKTLLMGANGEERLTQSFHTDPSCDASTARWVEHVHVEATRIEVGSTNSSFFPLLQGAKLIERRSATASQPLCSSHDRTWRPPTDPTLIPARAPTRRTTRGDLRFHRLFNGLEGNGPTIGAWCSFCNATVGESNASHGEFDAVECGSAAVQSSEFQTLQTSGMALTCPEFLSGTYVS